jgi:hypothetical protein
MRSLRARVLALALGSRGAGAFAALTAGALALLAAVPAAAAPMDASANDVADRVMDPDKLYSNFLIAEKRLNAALKKCGRNACSKGVRARLYRDLGVVYIIGLRRLDKGKELLVKAVKADPSIELDQRVATPELEQLFVESGGSSQPRATEPKAAAPAAEDEPAPTREPEAESAPSASTADSSASDSSKQEASADSVDGDARLGLGLDSEEEPEEAEAEGEEDEPEESQKKPEEKPEAPGKKKTFVSLGLQQDFLYYSGDAGVCSEGVDVYDCFDHRGTEYEGPLFEGAGNEVEGGLSRATTRLLIGYDRQLSSNALVGVRLGYAFGGGPTPVTGSGFLPWHVELRGAFYFGHRPFEARRIRPNLSLGAGLAEISSRVAVDYWESEDAFNDEAEAGTLDSWRRSGKLFIAPGFGTMIPVASRGAITLDVRAMFMIGKSATALALAVGYALGI